MPNSKGTTADAEIVLKLYDLRREPVMRKARSFLFGFVPKSAGEILKIANAYGTEENAYLRQVTSYWEMAASFVLHDALHEGMFLDSANEMLFVYARFQPFLAEVREKLGSKMFLAKCEELINRSSNARTRLENIKERQKKIAAAGAKAGK